ncbi:MAG TPA: hypothetical protein VNE63_02975 [Candidatus Acidoferrales bacterium]|nr:hypothetical protein [Candidatus Acidoferrales bacterium]
MRADWGKFKALLGTTAREAKVRKRLLAITAIILFLQLYFVRELVAAELMFGLGFAVMLALGAILYTLGAIGERSFNWIESGVHRMAPLVRHGYSRIEAISRKPSRHPRSESVQ